MVLKIDALKVEDFFKVCLSQTKNNKEKINFSLYISI